MFWEKGSFRYFDRGNLATVGRRFAIAEVFGLKLSGFMAWVIWAVVHIYYLIGFRNRLAVLLEWAWAYFAYQGRARLITPVQERVKEYRHHKGHNEVA